MLSSLLLKGVIAATIAVPVLAATPGDTRPIEPVNGSHYQFVDNEKGFEPMQCEVNLLSKTDLEYLLFDANQCGGGFAIGRGHMVEPGVPAVPSEEPIYQTPS